MKKVTTWVALAASAAMLLTACTSGNGSDAETKPAETSAGTETEAKDPVTLTVWESLEGRADFIKAAGEAFKETHPHVTIEYKNVELTDAPGQIALDGPAGVGADVFAAPSDKAGSLQQEGHILPIAEPHATELKGSLVAGAIANASAGDTLLGVPVNVDTYALFYNKDLIAEAPKTYEEVITFAKDFNSKNPGSYGYVFEPSFYYAAPFLFNSESSLFGPEGTDPAQPNTNSEAAVAGMEEMVKLREVLDVDAADLATASVDALFVGGKAAMHVTGTWNIPVFDDAGLNYGVAPLPARAGSDTPSGGFSNSRTMYVSAYTEHPEEAQAFAAFLASPEMLKVAFELTGSVPSAEIAIESEPTLGIVAQGAYAFPTPSIAEMGGVWEPMNAAVANMWNGADIKAELDKATEAINAQ